MTDNEKKIEPIDIIQLDNEIFVSGEETKTLISKVPINVLFNPEGIQKRDVWEIDLIKILSMLLKILEKADKKVGTLTLKSIEENREILNKAKEEAKNKSYDKT